MTNKDRLRRAGWIVGCAVAVIGLIMIVTIHTLNLPPNPMLMLSQSYRDGRSWAHNWYSDPDRYAYAQQSMKQGGTAAFGCRIVVNVVAKPHKPDQWIDGCIDGTHDMGLKP